MELDSVPFKRFRLGGSIYRVIDFWKNNKRKTDKNFLLVKRELVCTSRPWNFENEAFKIENPPKRVAVFKILQ